MVVSEGCFVFVYSGLIWFFVDFMSMMVIFWEVWDFLVVVCFEDIIDEDEFLLLWDLNMLKNFDFFYEDYGWFDLDEMDDLECLVEFRVKKCDFLYLVVVLWILN